MALAPGRTGSSTWFSSEIGAQSVPDFLIDDTVLDSSRQMPHRTAREPGPLLALRPKIGQHNLQPTEPALGNRTRHWIATGAEQPFAE